MCPPDPHPDLLDRGPDLDSDPYQNVTDPQHCRSVTDLDSTCNFLGDFNSPEPQNIPNLHENMKTKIFAKNLKFYRKRSLVWHLSYPEPPTREGPGVQLVSREAVKADAGQAGGEGDEEYGHHQPHRHHRHSHHAHLHLLHHNNHIRNSSIQCFGFVFILMQI
jgi:hypothetical protein